MIKPIFSQSKWLVSLIILVIAILPIVSCTSANQLPVISSLIANNEGEINPGDGRQIECIASDPDGDELTYTWTASGGTISGEGPTVSWTAPDAPGIYTIRVEVSDGRDGIATEQLTIEVLAPNNTPVIESLTAEWERVEKASNTPISCVASDPDGDELSYSWTASGGTISGEGPAVSWTAPDAPGIYTIRVEVSDGRDGIATEQLTIEVLASNNTPVIESLTTDCPRVRPTRTAIIECIASDPDGDELSYSWTASDGTISGEGPTVSWTAPDELGTFTVTVTVTDGEGGEVSRDVEIIACVCGSAC